MIEPKLMRIRKLALEMEQLTGDQLEVIEKVVQQFTRPYTRIHRREDSDIVNGCLLEVFGDALRIHHCFSKEPLAKDKFEYALERAANLCGFRATLAPKGNPGHDITIDDVPISLKTEAAAGIKIDRIHISKFMELGKGEWLLDLLREQFFKHMSAYERIFSLRCLSRKPERWHYGAPRTVS